MVFFSSSYIIYIYIIIYSIYIYITIFMTMINENFIICIIISEIIKNRDIFFGKTRSIYDSNDLLDTLLVEDTTSGVANGILYVYLYN